MGLTLPGGLNSVLRSIAGGFLPPTFPLITQGYGVCFLCSFMSTIPNKTAETETAFHKLADCMSNKGKVIEDRG